MSGLATMVDTDLALADIIGGVLDSAGAGSEHIVDAHCVAAVVATTGHGTVLTGDPSDMQRLAAHYPTVGVQGL